MGATVATPTDHQSSETHHHGHGHGFMDHHGHHGLGHGHHHHGGDGKYFTNMDAYLIKHGPGKYEAGHVEETPKGWEVRYERVDGNTKQGKVKWGDMYGGYGEHYWDYNHAGSGHDDGGHGHGHYSEPVPSYENQPNGSSHNRNVATLHKRQSDGHSGSKNKDKRSKAGSKRVSTSSSSSSASDKEADMNIPLYPIGDSKASESRGMPMLVLDRKTGQIIDTETGKAYLLKPNARSYY